MAIEGPLCENGELFINEDKRIELFLLNGPVDKPGVQCVDMSGWTVVLDVRKKDTSDDPPLFFQTAVISGTFNPDPVLNMQVAYITIDDQDTNTFRQIPYRYSWKRTGALVATVLRWGDAPIQKATAK